MLIRVSKYMLTNYMLYLFLMLFVCVYLSVYKSYLTVKTVKIFDRQCVFATLKEIYIVEL